MMNVAAAFAPGTSLQALQPFRREGMRVSIVDDLPGAEALDALLVFGGDGTVNRYLPYLVQTKTPVLVVPAGSGNDFARAMGTGSRRKARAAWGAFGAGQDNVREVDAGVIQPLGGEAQPAFFCNIAGVGLDAEANRRANAMPGWLRSRGGYVLAGLAAIARFHPQTITIEATAANKNFHYSEPATLAAIANTRSYGGGICIAPLALPDDGRLDVCVIRRAGRKQLLRLFPRVFRGTHLHTAEVEYFPAEDVRLGSEIPLEVYADGEYICRTPVEVSVRRKALRVIVPPAAVLN